MSANPKIENLFIKDIRRKINGVIKVDQDDDDSVYTELEEYVVTQESLKHFDTFFERYYDATQTPTDNIGVWVSGFFGSGKSHFIKIISYLLENKTVRDRTSLDFFREKITDPQLFDTIEKAVNYGTKDIILFNIDSKAGDSKERIVNILMRAFNEHRGFFGDVFWIAELEEDLHDKGLYDAFKEEVSKISGSEWDDIRDKYSFEQDDIVEALTTCGHQSREASVRMLENDGRNYYLGVEKFASEVEKYCRSKGDDHQVIFLVDEVGQYIGEDSELMLNLQTVAEELGTKLRGKAWVIVTSQADIDTVTKERVKGYDFSKIQARFDTRLSLSSANVDEVIKTRILRKKGEHREMLASSYTNKKTILKNLISFSKGSAEMKNYKEEGDFADVYPFVPYHFNLLQKVFEKIRSTGFTGKHLAKGERSMLSAFKESTEKYGQSEVGVLIPFHSFYSTVESFLDPIIVKTITHAEKNDQLTNPGDCDLLKILFMIRHVTELPPTLDNLVVLSISNIDEDKLGLRHQVAESLKRLEEQTLIDKSGDAYHFLTNEEQMIDREIKNIDIEAHQILDEIYNVIYNTNDICPTKYKEHKFNKSVDDKVKKVSDADLTVKFLTPLSDEMSRGSGQRSLSGDNLSNIDSTDTLLFIFPEQSQFVEQIRNYLKINKYLLQSGSNRDNDEIQKIVTTKRQKKDTLEESSVQAIHKGVQDARIFVDGREVTSIDKNDPKNRVIEGLDILVQNVYRKSSYITNGCESETDILRILRSDDLEKFGVEKGETNKLAMNEVRDYISIRDEKNTTIVLKYLKGHFMRKPYGWKDLAISGLIATLFIVEEVKLRYQKTYLSDPEEITRYLTRRETADKLIIEIRKKTGTETISSVKSVMRDVFDKTAIPEKESELYDFSQDRLKDELRSIEPISVKYSGEIRYPGKAGIENYVSLLKRLQHVTDTSSFLETVAEARDKLVGMHQKIEPVISFFNSTQLEIFGRLSKNIETFKRNAQFLSEDARSDVDEIESILASNEPYSQIKDLPQLESRIEKSLKESLSDLKQDVVDRLQSARDDIEIELGEYSGFTDEFKQSVIDLFDDVKEKISESDDCAFVKLQLREMDELQRHAHGLIESCIEEIRDTEKRGYGTIGTADDWVPAKIIDASIFTTKKNIETKEDLDEYLENLRAVMQKILKENTKIKVL